MKMLFRLWVVLSAGWIGLISWALSQVHEPLAPAYVLVPPVLLGAVLMGAIWVWDGRSRG